MVRPKKIVKKWKIKKMNILSTSEGLIVFSGSAYRQIEKQEDKKWEF